MSSPEDLNNTIRLIALKLFGSLPKPSSVELADLVQAGNVGLLQATKTYDPTMGVPLPAYARFRIRGEMLDAVNRASPLGNHVRVEEMSVRIKTIPVELWREDIAPRQEWIPEKLLCRSQHRKLLNDEMKRMPAKDRIVLELKYAEDFTLRQIGTLLKVKESRASQIHRRALARLRRALGRRGLNKAA